MGRMRCSADCPGILALRELTYGNLSCPRLFRALTSTRGPRRTAPNVARNHHGSKERSNVSAQPTVRLTESGIQAGSDDILTWVRDPAKAERHGQRCPKAGRRLPAGTALAARPAGPGRGVAALSRGGVDMLPAAA